MQPAIKMALRIARQGTDYLKAHFERQDIAGNAPEERERQLERVTGKIYENFSEQLQKAYKDHYIAPAGDGDADGHALSWHVFPVLGSENLLRGIPEFALALVQKKDNRTENLLLINPVTGEEYSASRGRGASLNNRRMRASEVKHLADAMVVTNLLRQARGSDNPLVWGELSAQLASQSNDLRTCGCSVLDIARVAAGYLDAIVLFRPTPEDMDIGLALANEAGILSGDFSGNPSRADTRQLAIANPKLFRELLRTLHPFQSRLPR
ncbi:myo-inositol-1(or 4)-monophosphatase [Marinobacter daqiaonensis]|uniref:Myo-inositol-1(Or 4)-monophosphatase n=1 Tax=Marinobacter daqiaonensis TaxID=650891 RepID=A0A1I6GL67_9GAMM|nr:inositol monophosphatase family protein [Marinobacter daqiaonensis]SFR42943.1 myo-inositol-1(or 4)-monophosphatase [Marinobacter daqiaonensis]